MVSQLGAGATPDSRGLTPRPKVDGPGLPLELGDDYENDVALVVSTILLRGSAAEQSCSPMSDR